jgi:hypothetical protein
MFPTSMPIDRSLKRGWGKKQKNNQSTNLQKKGKGG